MLKRKRLIPEETKDEIEGYESSDGGEERMDVDDDDAVDADEINPLGFCLTTNYQPHSGLTTTLFPTLHFI